jgi:membrane-bound metal-dependent hydrolase YbcI (DUF457 family)
MDILTHAGIGLIAASPFLADRPELAVGVVAGSVLPDLDALCRLVNKRTFLRAHQTWSHVLPVHLGFSLAVGALATAFGWRGIDLGAGLFVGLLGHSVLDMTNTYGVAWLAPFLRRRICLEWVFFIDAVVLAGVAATLALVIPIWLQRGEVPARYAVAFLAGLSAYVLCKGMLRRRAGRFCPGAKSLVPSALVPWRFYGTERQPHTIKLFSINAMTGARSPVGEVSVLDDAFAGALERLPEFRLMREVSPEYHVVGAWKDGPVTRLLCRDMRMRNFGTRFGDLEVWLDSNRQVARSRFHA